jgi:DNA invertase Pin-like site-specific DNA recombinase
MKLAAYIRVSTSRQATESDSLDGQKLAITKWASQNDHVVVKHYVEGGYSAFKGKRPALEQMLSDIQSSDVEYQGVVVYSLSRFARNEQKRLVSDSLIADLGFEFFSVTESFPTDPALAHLVKSLLGTVNEHQSRQNSKVVSDRKAEAVEKGFFVGGAVPYGYKSVPAPDSDKSKKILVVNSEQAEIVRDIYRLAIEGNCGRPYGVKKIATYLNTSGIPANVSNWTTMKVHRVLTDPIYIAQREYAADRRIKRADYKPIYYKNPQILDVEVFNRVQAELKQRAPQKNTEEKGIRSPSILTGLLKCSSCRKNLVLSSGKSGHYWYYRCVRRIKENINVCTCPNLPKVPLENKVKELIAELVMPEEALSEYVQTLKVKHKEVFRADRQRLLAVQAKSSKVTDQYEKLIMHIAKGELELDSTAKDTIGRLKRSQDGLQMEARSLKERMQLPIKKFGQSHISLFAQAARNILLGDDNEATKALLVAIVKEIVVYPTKLKFSGGLLPLAAIISRVDRNMGTSLQVPIFISKWR